MIALCTKHNVIQALRYRFVSALHGTFRLHTAYVMDDI